MKNKPELLAPAGSWEAMVAAIQNGADAIYMGGAKFNARRQASNFDNEALRKAVEYAHLYGVRVYITLNTLIKEKEWEELKAFIPVLEEYRVDGVIVQDIGVAGYIAQNHPNLFLHASTQMTIHQLEGVQLLEEMGFDRVIFARELSLNELKFISDNSDMELETFVHGALCVSYSGQCLMSSMLGGRSGNRGMCAQPCRLAYTLNKDIDPNAQQIYHLSTKDISTIDLLDEILAAGVSSFKLEGRMKRPEYVAVVTREYRKALDSILETGKFQDLEASKQELEQIFNRGGFSKGYYYGTDHSNLTASEKPNHWGTYLGTIAKVDRGMVWLNLEEDLEIGDGIEFWSQNQGSSNRENKGQAVSSILFKGKQVDLGIKGQLVRISSSIRPESGTKVYRTSKASQLRIAKESFQNPYGRTIPISANVTTKIDGNPILVFRDTQGLEGKAVGEQAVQKAMNRALARQTLWEQLGRLGDTAFELQTLEWDGDDNVFLPVSVLNQLRRDATEDLLKNRIEYFNNRAVSYNKKNRPVKPNLKIHSVQMSQATQLDSEQQTKSKQLAQSTLPSLQDKQSYDRPRLNGYVDSIDVDSSLLDGLDTLSFAPSSFSFKLEMLKDQVKAVQQSDIPVRLVLPTITRMDDMTLLRSLPDYFWSMFDDYQIGNIGQIKLLQDKGIYECFGSHTLNVTNAFAMDQLSALGLKGVTLSPELTLAEIRDIMKKASMLWEV
ncbi:MAG: U32 family peptidase, partial [Clostridiales bacterium]|nr:U32 family peptidase [Clostridiales bacterium]